MKILLEANAECTWYFSRKTRDAKPDRVRERKRIFGRNLKKKLMK
jgi:hypothetical protein